MHPLPCTLAAERTAGVASTSAPSLPSPPRPAAARRRAPAPRQRPGLRDAAARRPRTACRSFNLGDGGLGELRRWLGLDPSGGGGKDFDADAAPIRSLLQSVFDMEEGPRSGDARAGPSSAATAADGEAAAAAPPPLGDWSAGLDDAWDEWSGAPGVADLDDDGDVAELREAVIARRQARRGRRTRVRDEYLRPIVDATGIYNRLAIGEREAEERVFVEAITNQYESREALRYAGVLLAVPLAAGFVASRLLAQPLWEYAEGVNPAAFALTDGQKVEGAEAVHREEVRLRMEASLGQAPPLADADMLAHLRQEARSFEAEMRLYNRQALLNVVSDSTTAAAIFAILLRDTSERAILFRTIGRVFAGMSGAWGGGGGRGLAGEGVWVWVWVWVGGGVKPGERLLPALHGAPETQNRDKP
jgi:hypothetical protein